jgi:hypothetical protein
MQAIARRESAARERHMHILTSGEGIQDQQALDFYRDALQSLAGAEVPFLVGGAYAFHRYAQIARYTKDFDIFVMGRDVDRLIDVLAGRGYDARLLYPHWLAKVRSGDAFMDVIFNSGNGVVPVDDEWFDHAPQAEVLGLTMKLCPVEEMIWSKSFVIERERTDAADVAHLIRHCAGWLNWPRLVRRYGANWRVLLAHLVFFGFIYPDERARVPESVMRELMGRLERELTVNGTERVCNGTLLSREQYLVDVEKWGYEDARIFPRGSMTPEDIATWSEAIGKPED